VAGCGRNDFNNDPRPPIPAEVSVKIAPDGVAVSPKEFGAGLVNFTIANQTSNPATFRLSGPTSARSAEIPPQAPTTLTANLKTGTYRASAGGDRGLPSTTFKVGPERRSSQNKLLLP
jgi:hypothetical protein